ncbi:hypothetical protein VaNZ11_007875, partial [Volvox africanus]
LSNKRMTRSDLFLALRLLLFSRPGSSWTYIARAVGSPRPKLATTSQPVFNLFDLYLHECRASSRARKINCDPSWYSETVEHIASWGYVVLQYILDWDVAKQIGEAGEMPYLAPLLEWLGNLTLDGTRVHADFSRKAVMGHSRGGKLAALHYASNSTAGGITTAILLDPVDCMLSGKAHPSAVAKLLGADVSCGEPLEGGRLPSRRSKLAAAVMGAAPMSKCTPNGTSYQSFADAVSLDSWKIWIIKGGHMGFASSSDEAYLTLDEQCGAGEVPPQRRGNGY